MAPTGKRTRQTAESENPSSSASTSTPPSASMAPPTPSSRPATRRALQATVSLSDLGSPNNNPAVGAMTPPETPSPNRPILTRSATTRAPGNSPLTRAASMFTPSRRDDAPLSPAGSSFASGSGSGFGSGSLASSYIGLGTPSGVSGPRTRSGLLTRTQSSPSLASPGALKACLAPGGSSTGKGGPEDVFGFGGRKYGRGKENIPPRKEDEENQRKRLRVTSGPRSVSSRGRSGSVASVRSESSSSASSYYSCGPGLLSPSPSPSTPASSRSSVDPLDLIGSELDVDRTPTKARPVRDTRVMPTPPASSSPFLAATSTDIDSARRRMSLVKMASTSSLATISSSEDASGSDTETETDPDPFTASSPSKYKPKNAYKHLKSLLRLSATADKSTSDGIIGREEEKDALRAYFSMRSDKDVGMYVSGPPGTGKTALVTAMCKEMAREGAKVVELGCMGLKVNDVWRRLGQGLGCGVTEEEVGRYMAQNTRDTLIILDEIDSLLPAPPAMPTSATSHLLSKIFSFPLLSTANRTVKLIAISNTLDLTVRAKLVLPSGAQPAVLPFKAYGATDMARIVFARLETITVGEDAVKVDLKAVELLTRKVEAQNGDLRMCLATLAAAVSLAEAEWVKKTLSASDLGAATTPLIKVSLPHVIKAFSSHTQQLKAAAGSAHPSATTSGGVESATARKIRSVPLQGKMVLVSILVYLSRSRAGLPGIPTCTTSSASSGPSPSSTPHRHGDLTTSNLYATYSALMSHESSPFPPAAESDYRDLLSNLETLGLVSIVGFGGGSYAMSTSLSGSGASRGSASSRSKNSAGAPRVELCVRDDEVRQGLGLGEVGQDGIAQGKGRADEEVGKVWAREEVKVVRQREKIARAAEALKAVSAEQE